MATFTLAVFLTIFSLGLLVQITGDSDCGPALAICLTVLCALFGTLLAISLGVFGLG